MHEVSLMKYEQDQSQMSSEHALFREREHHLRHEALKILQDRPIRHACRLFGAALGFKLHDKTGHADTTHQHRLALPAPGE
jgi:hypothetical protein